jgi:hypothetical protein
MKSLSVTFLYLTFAASIPVLLLSWYQSATNHQGDACASGKVFRVSDNRCYTQNSKAADESLHRRPSMSY